MRWRSIFSKYPIILTFSVARNNSLRKYLQYFSLLTLIPFLFTNKALVTPYHEIADDAMTFWDISFVELSTFSSGTFDFFSLPRTWSFLTLTSRVKFLPSFVSGPAFFFAVVLNDYFIFISKNNSFLLKLRLLWVSGFSL